MGHDRPAPCPRRDLGREPASLVGFLLASAAGAMLGLMCVKGLGLLLEDICRLLPR